jgi:hypothetical protein
MVHQDVEDLTIVYRRLKRNVMDIDTFRLANEEYLDRIVHSQ